MKKVVFDIEADGLLPTVSKIWIVVAKDIDTNEVIVFSDYDNDSRPLSELPNFLDNCGMLIAHNMLMYDLLVLEKFLNWKPTSAIKLVDTLVVSQVLNYYRFGGRHSLAKWGEFLGYSKQEHEEWDRYSPEMRSRCITDVELNHKVFNELNKELGARKNKETLKLGIQAEQAASRFSGLATLYGWPFDVDKALKLKGTFEARLKEIEDIIEPQLKTKCVQIDKDPEFKSPVWIKNGNYSVRTASWFNIVPEKGQEGRRPIWGDYCRVDFESPEIGSLEAVKAWLYTKGWKPLTWNRNKETGVRTTPKLCDESLKLVGPEGEMLSEYYTTRARHSILTGWLNLLDSNNRLHGDIFVIGTPTMRARHSIIANIPGADSLYGKEITELFSTIPGYKLVGIDSKGNQNRGLCHYLANEVYTKAVVSGDVHTLNKEILEKFAGNLGSEGRGKAKRFLYALTLAHIKLRELGGRLEQLIPNQG